MKTTRSNWLGPLAVLLSICGWNAQADEVPVDYLVQVRPILANKCYQCHGPDGQQRKAGIRFDDRDSALGAAESGARAVVPGKPDESALVRRIESHDDQIRMPPPESKKSLTEAERIVLRKWVAQGARYSTHWSFVAPRQEPIPMLGPRAWPRGPIDCFVQKRHLAADLGPSPEADRVTLIRRASLDLIGLPPTISEIDAFTSDPSPAAYDRLVDRLLASPHLGERLALEWLDASRYADTHGYHIDSGRDMTRWREWVIQAFNQGMPFDQFTIEQLAGDLLPNATLDQKIASGFNRNHMINFEGGAIPEEYHTAYIVDRVNTTGAVWLGLTVGCAQCHDHKYDPISQRDYYQFFAFFHNVAEKGLDGSRGNAAPLIKAPTPVEQQQLERLAESERALRERLQKSDPILDELQARWEREVESNLYVKWSPVEEMTISSDGGIVFERLADGSFRAHGAPPDKATYITELTLPPSRVTGIRIETLTDDRLEHKGPGRSSNGNFVLSNISVGRVSEQGTLPLKIKSATADFAQPKFLAEHAIDDNRESGWGIYPEVGKPHHLVLDLDESISFPSGGKLRIELAFQSQYAQHQIACLRISVTDAKSPNSVQLPDPIRQSLLAAVSSRTPQQLLDLRTYFRSTNTEFANELKQLASARDELDKQVRSVMVMEEMAQPRETFVLTRGQYDKRGERVAAATPAALPAISVRVPATRLGLAHWLTSPDQPLTARVVVNRYWQMLFGTGLVKTSEDFGTQGELPSHPELLDWLAVEFRGTGVPNETLGSRVSTSAPEASFDHTYPWDVKRLLRAMVSSATYRQTSRLGLEQSGSDPENRLLARGPRFRLPAEFIRDQALAIAGLIDRRIGGVSVFPYQPPGLWEELMSREDGANWTAQKYVQDRGVNLYRRSLYTFWKRTSPPPTMSTFDAPDREICSVRRAITNTPMQGLILMNDPTYIESARLFAETILRDGGNDDLTKIQFAFRTIVGRVPAPREIEVLHRALDQHRDAFRKNVSLVTRLLTVGEYPRNAELDGVEVAAWCMVASALLNLDETITKG